MRNLIIVLGLIATLCASRASADITVASVFRDHMVLQRDDQVPVWGWAEPG